MRSEMQVFLKDDNAAWGKKSFHLYNSSSRSWSWVVWLGRITILIYSFSLETFILEYNLNTETAILSV